MKNLLCKFSVGREQLEIYLSELLEIKKLSLRTIKQIKTFLIEYNLMKEMELLSTVPGIGFITAVTLLTEIMDPKRFPDLDNLASYVGLVPCILSSSDKQKTLRIKFHHNRFLRQLLIEAAWVAVRKDPALTYSYHNYIRRMSKQEAIIRIAKKLLSRINYVWINKKPYVISIVK
jgi:transposase